jgi:tetratricopeptide (TPR) repeat protein
MIIATILLCLALQEPVTAQQPIWWVGQEVVIKDDYPLKIKDQVVPTRGFQVYTVRETRGDWLWVVCGEVRGWVPASQVVLFPWALAHFTREIAANPARAAGWNCRGHIWRELRQYAEAIADFSEAIRLHPKANHYADRGNGWCDKKDYDRAIADFNEAIRLDPKYSRAYCGRGRAWYAKSSYDLAIADFSKAIGLDVQDAEAFRGRGAAWNAKKDIDKAIADFSEAVSIDRGDVSIYCMRGQAWMDKKEYDKAIADFNTALAISPGDVSAAHGRDLARWALKQAQKELERARWEQESKRLAALHDQHVGPAPDWLSFFLFYMITRQWQTDLARLNADCLGWNLGWGLGRLIDLTLGL